jgi:putative colanic acid biosynthesis acetyltransferase WcaF
MSNTLIISELVGCRITDCKSGSYTENTVIFNPVQTNEIPTFVKLKNIVWRIINKTVFRIIPPYTSVCRKLKVAMLRMFGAKVAWSCSISSSANIEYPWNLTMEHLSSLSENVWAYCMEKITIGEKCCIGKDVYLLTGSHDIEISTFNLIIKPITINSNTWVATGSYILPNVTIGKNCVIAAKSLVTKSVENNSVVGGNPAKFIKKREIKFCK